MSVVQPPARPGVQVSSPNEADHRRQIAQGVNRLNQGQCNATLFVTLDPNVTSTEVVDARISGQTFAGLQPQTAHAAAALPTTYVVCTNGSAIINHGSAASTDRLFTMCLIG